MEISCWEIRRKKKIAAAAAVAGVVGVVCVISSAAAAAAAAAAVVVVDRCWDCTPKMFSSLVRFQLCARHTDTFDLEDTLFARKILIF